MPGPNPYLELLEEEERAAPEPAPEPPAAGGNQYLELLEEQEREGVPPSLEERAEQRDATVAESMDDTRVPLERRAAILELAGRSRLPADLVERHFERLSAADQRAPSDPAAWSRENPDLADLATAARALGPIVVRDDNASWFRRQLRAFDAWNRIQLLERAERGPWFLPEGLGKDYDEWLSATFPWDRPPETTKAEESTKFGQAMGTLPPAQQAFVEDPEAKRIRAAGFLAQQRAAFEQGLRENEIGEVGVRLMAAEAAGLDTWGLEKRLVDLRNAALPRDLGGGELSKFFQDGMAVAASSVQMLERGGMAAAGGAAVGAAITRSPGGAMQGARVGFLTGATAASFELEAGQAYLQLREAKTDDGRPVPRDLAIGGAVLYGLLAAGVERWSFGAAAQSLGPVAEAFYKGQGMRAILKASKEEGFGRLLQRMAVGWARRAKDEGAEEFVQKVLEDWTAWGARTAAAGEAQSLDASGGFTGAIEATYGAVASAAGGGAVQTGGAALATYALARATRDGRAALAAQIARDTGEQRSVATIASLSELAKGPLAQASAEEAAAYVAKTTEGLGEKVTEVFVDAAPVLQLMQEANLDPVAVVGQEVATALTDAVATGAKAAIPVGQYVTLLRDERLTEVLPPHASTRPSYASLVERKQNEKDLEERTAALVAQYDKEEAPPPAGAERRLMDALQAQIVRTGVYKDTEAKHLISLTRAGLRNLAARAGVKPKVVFDLYRIQVERLADQPAPAGAVEQPKFEVIAGKLDHPKAAIPSDMRRLRGRLVEQLVAHRGGEGVGNWAGTGVFTRQDLLGQLAQFHKEEGEKPGLSEIEREMHRREERKYVEAMQRDAAALVGAGVSDLSSVANALRYTSVSRTAVDASLRQPVASIAARLEDRKLRKLEEMIEGFNQAFPGQVEYLWDHVNVRQLKQSLEEEREQRGGAQFPPGPIFYQDEDSASAVVKKAFDDADAPRVINGKIVGAPPGRLSQRHLVATVEKVLKAMQDPLAVMERSKWWYEDAAAEIARLTQGDLELREKVVRLVAFFSAASGVRGNITGAIRAMYQIARGEPPAAGRWVNVNRERLPVVLDTSKPFDQSMEGISDKIESFYRNLHDPAFRENRWPHESTMDRWMMRFYGYPEREAAKLGAGGASRLSPTQYKYARFVTRVAAELWTARTGERLHPRQVQAVLWTFEKNSTDRAKKKGAARRDFEPTTYGFHDALREATASLTFETFPSTTAVPNFELTPAQKRALHNRAMALLVDERGHDLVLQQLLGTDAVMRAQVEGIGAYAGGLNITQISQLTLEKVDGETLQELADSYADLLGYVLRQDAVPWHRLDPKGDVDGIMVRTPAPIDPADQQRLLDHLNRELGRTDMGFTQIGNELRILNFTGFSDAPLKAAQFQAQVLAALKTWDYAAQHLDAFDLRAQAAYRDNDWGAAPDGERYAQRLAAAGRSGVLGWARGRREAFDALVAEFRADPVAAAGVAPRASEAGGVAPRLEQPVLHGTPARDHPGVFDRRFIGTGEGTQAQGFGFYFTKSPIASRYYSAMRGGAMAIRFNGHDAFNDSDVSDAEREAATALQHAFIELYDDTDQQFILTMTGGAGPPNYERILADAVESLEDVVADLAGKDQKLYAPALAKRREALAVLKALRPEGISIEPTTGRILEVDIPPDEELLQWEKPLYDQHPKVLDKLEKMVPGLKRYAQNIARGVIPSAAGLRVKGVSKGRGRVELRPDQSVREAYAQLVAAFDGEEEQAADQFAAFGIAGHKYESDEGNENYVIWDERRIQLLRVLAQQDTRGARGFMQRISSGVRIAFTEKADRTTYLHEMGHVFLDVMGELAQRDGASEQLRLDYAAALEWTGFGTEEQRQAMMAEASEIQTRAAIERRELTAEERARLAELVAPHEKWARGFETYLFDGRAPSPRLRRAFRAFKSWLKQVYAAITSLATPLNQEVRDVFDRLLASDAEIERAHRDMGGEAGPVPKDLLTPEEFKKYEKALSRARERGREKLERNLLADRVREHEDWWRVQERKLRKEVRQEWDRQRPVRAKAFLDGRALLDDGTVVKGPKVRLQRAAVVAILGKRRAASVRTSKTGVPPDEVAEQLGYGSGKEMLEEVAALPERDEHVRLEARRRMRDRYPDLAQQRDELAARAQEHMHGPQSATALLLELDGLRRRAGTFATGAATVRAPPAAIERAGREITERQRLADLPKNTYLRAQRKAAKQKAQAIRAGDWESAANLAQLQLLNFHAHAHTLALRREMETARRYVGKKRKESYRAELAKASPTYLLLWDAVRAATGLGPPLEMREGLDRELADALADLQARAEAAASPLEFDVEGLRQLLTERPPWAGMKLAEARLARDAVSNLRAMAVAERRIQLGQSRQDLEAFAARLVEGMKALPFLGKERDVGGERVQRGSTVDRLVGFHGKLIDPELMFESMGEAGRELWNRYLERKTLKHEMVAKVLGPWLELVQSMPPSLMATRFDHVPGIEKDLPYPNDLNLDEQAPRTYLWLIMVALNAGNESNLDRLVGGFGWTREQVFAALDKHFTKAHWDFVQSIWNLFDKELWPEIAAKEARKNGVAPAKIQPREITTRFGVYRGGYFPARYNPVAGAGDIGERQAEESIASLYGPGYRRASVSHSFVKQRADQYRNVLLLDWSVVTGHVAQAIHDVAFDEFVRDAGRVVFHPSVKSALYQHLGKDRANDPRDWLRHIAAAQTQANLEGMKEFMDAQRWLRERMVAGAIGHSLTVAMADFTNAAVASSVGRREGGIHPAYGVRGWLAAFPLNPRFLHWRHFAVEHSQELRNRLAVDDNERRLLHLKRVGLQQSRWNRLMEDLANTNWFWFRQTDKMASTSIWLARYWHEVDRGEKPARAEELADQAVRNTLPSPEPSEKPPLLRNPHSGVLLVFFSYFAKLYNMLYGRIGSSAVRGFVRAGRGEISYGSATLNAAWMAGKSLSLVSWVAIGDLFSGRGPETDEEWQEWLMRKALAGYLAPLPFGVMAEPVVAGLLTGEPRALFDVSPRAAPAVSVIGAWGKSLLRVAEEGVEPQDAAMAATEAVLRFYRLPVSQPKRTLGYLYDVLTDETEVGGPGDVAAGLIYGERENQPLNPITAIEGG